MYTLILIFVTGFGIEHVQIDNLESAAVCELARRGFKEELDLRHRSFCVLTGEKQSTIKIR